MTRRYAIVALCGAIGVTVAHIAVARYSGVDMIVRPISGLSRGALGGWHSAGLAGFAVAQVLLALGMAGLDRGWLWRLGRLLLVLAGLGVGGVALYFATADSSQLVGAHANDPLSVVACLVGVAMAALQRGWSRTVRWMGRVNAVCFAGWLLLVPLILLVTDAWLGGYERLVGATYVTWVGAQAIALLKAR
ncbi:MAG: DUF998 domain-containing protein [Pseudomonadota bacterium]